MYVEDGRSSVKSLMATPMLFRYRGDYSEIGRLGEDVGQLSVSSIVLGWELIPSRS